MIHCEHARNEMLTKRYDAVCRGRRESCRDRKMLCKMQKWFWFHWYMLVSFHWVRCRGKTAICSDWRVVAPFRQIVVRPPTKKQKYFDNEKSFFSLLTLPVHHHHHCSSSKEKQEMCAHFHFNFPDYACFLRCCWWCWETGKPWGFLIIEIKELKMLEYSFFPCILLSVLF